jgi:hypothetical protein
LRESTEGLAFVHAVTKAAGEAIMSTFHSRARIRIHAAARKVVRPRTLSFVVLLPVLPLVFILLVDNVLEFRDRSPQRGAATCAKDLFADGYESVRYLDQGWSQGQSSWFYTVDQGSDLLPYDFFLSLSSSGSDERLRSDDNVKRWRYLPQAASRRNPDALPVGFARDEYKGQEYVGLTCAACHTGQVNYRGVALRIDGGPSMADMQGFIRDLVAALDATAQVDAQGRCAGDVCKRFVARVLARGHYKDETAITRDLVASRQRIVADQITNQSGVAYGYARLDAFGRIYNRLLRRILQKKHLADILPDVYDAKTLPAVQRALSPVLEGGQDDDVIERALPLLSDEQRQPLVANVFNPSSAPVSYPFLWDTPQHDYVQWNGIVSNSDFGPLGRNSGEVIGVFGTLDWSVKRGSTLSSLIGGQRVGDQHVSYESSIYVHNLRRIESQLATLQSPQWPEDVLGRIDGEHAYNGKVLFAKHCAGCHVEIDRAAPDRRLVASMTRLEDIGTDPAMAQNSVTYAGYSGMLRNEYVSLTGVGNVLIDRRAPVAVLLTKAGRGVVTEPYPNANVFQRVADWVTDLTIDFFSNQIQASIKNGRYNPDSTATPFASLFAYKGRSLNGIWATAPYLHNGSVPTLYDVLLPKRRVGDPDGEEYRPDTFVVGSREFDPAKVGYLSQGYEGFVFDTSQAGNSNAGHEYGTIHDATLEERHAKPMTKQERMDVLEYLKGR